MCLPMEVLSMNETLSPLRILLVESNENDRLLFREAFQKSDIPYTLTGSARAEEALEQLSTNASSFDVVVVEQDLLGMSGMDLCNKLLGNKVPLPLVLFTKMGSEKLAVEALKAGVYGYIIKDPKQGYLELLPVSLLQVVRRHGDCLARRQAEDALRRGEERFKTIFDNSADGILLADVKSKRFYMGNKVICQMLGCDQQQLKNLAVADIHPEQDMPYVTEQIQKQIDGECTLSKDIPVKRRDGCVFYVDVNSFPITLEGKTYLMGIFRDVTERKRAEKALQQSEKKWYSLLRNAPDFILNIDGDGTILFINRTVPGYTIEDTVGKTVYNFLPPEQHEQTREAIKKVFESGESVGFETSVIGPDGRLIWYSNNLGPVKDGDKIVSVAQVSTDITKRKKIEEELQASELLYRTLFETMPVGVGLATIDGRVIDGNSAMIELTGYSATQLRQVNLNETYEDPGDRDRLLKQLQRDGYVHDFETKLKRKDGTTYCASLTLAPLKLRGKDVLLTVARDVTAYRTAQEKLKESEETLSSLVNAITESALLIDTEGTILAINESAAGRIGFNVNELMGKCAYDFLPSDVAEFRKSQVAKVVQTCQPVQFEDCSLGRHIYHSVSPVLDSSGKVIRLAIFGLDITERKRFEYELVESEERYRTLVETAIDPIITVDSKGVFLFMNKAAAEHLGGKPEDFVGKTMWDLFPKEIADRQAANVRKVIETGQGMNTVWSTELRGQARWYNTTIGPLRDGIGNIKVTLIIARNIDKIRQAEERIRTLSSVVEQSIDGIAIGDLEPKLLYVNDAYARMHGYTPEEMIGMKVVNLRSDSQVGEYHKAIHQLKTQGAWTGELEHFRKDGTAFPCYVSVSFLKNEQGEGTGILAVCRDITASKQKEDELKAYREQMARAEQLASLGTLSATVAHQLTQPLTVISLLLDNALDELEGTSSPKPLIRRLGDCATQVSNITSIINRFRNFARQSSDTSIGEVYLQAVAHRVVSLLDESARQVRIGLRIERMDKLPTVCMSERDLEQLFFALVENAIQAADSKKARQLVISGAVKDEHIELRFSDNCGGIAPENLNKIFEPFFTTKPRGQGTGLGLCIAQDIVSRAGGVVRVESKFGEGSTFFVTLPVNE